MVHSLYYTIKPLIPRRIQIWLRSALVRNKRRKYAYVWPIDERAARPPEGWTGWPEGKKFALVLTHDVETAKGVSRCSPLAELEKKLGFRSAYNFVAEDYVIIPELFNNLKSWGFEIGLHGLSHNGNLFRSEQFFCERVERINQYMKDWGILGFRSPSMFRNLEWIGELKIEYDSSTFDTDPFEPQSDGVGTIFPFMVCQHGNANNYVELPYTLPQDFSLFILMKEMGIDIWKRKLDWIVDKGGMVLLITHPDYMNLDGKIELSEYPVRYYEEFLQYIQKKYAEQYWNALPGEVACFWKGKFSSRDLGNETNERGRRT